MKTIARLVAPVLLGGFVSAAVYSDALADQASLDAILELCVAKSKMGSEACACVVDAAGKELNDNQQALMLAGLSRDEAQVNSLRELLSAQEANATLDFMSNAPKRCTS